MSISLKVSRDVIIRTPRFEQAKAFYAGVLKLPVAYQSDTLVGYELGSFKLYVEQGAQLGVVLDFIVADAAQTLAALKQAGCEIFEVEPAVPRTYVRDPFGLMFNVEQATPTLASD